MSPKGSIDHLHAGTLLRRVEQSFELLCSQYLASVLRPTHPSFQVVSQQYWSVTKNQTIRPRSISVMYPYLTNDIIHKTNCDNVIKDFPHHIVQMGFQNQPPNSILQDVPSEINPVKKKKKPSQGPWNIPISTEIGLLQSLNNLPKPPDPSHPAGRIVPYSIFSSLALTRRTS